MTLEIKGLDEKMAELRELQIGEKARYEEWLAEKGDHIRRFRRAILQVTPEFFMWIATGAFEVVMQPLPPDAKLVGAFYDHHRNLFGVVIESQEFEEVREGAILPTLHPPFFERLNG
jgi:hypothetical protein